MSYHSYLHWICCVLFLPKDKFGLCLLSWKLAYLVEEKETGLEILTLMLCGIQSNDLLDSQLLKSLFRPTTREKIYFKRSETETKKNIQWFVTRREERTRFPYIQLEILICLIAIQWGTFSGRLIILFKSKPDGCSYHKKRTTKKRA